MSECHTELAYYYPEPMWWPSDEQANWVKNLILYFDGIALLVPEYIKDKPFLVDPPLAEGLHEHGLLRILEPESFIDQKATEVFATYMADLLTSGVLDPLAKEPTAFAELSYSRLGYQADAGLGSMIYEELETRGLAKQSQDGVSIPMHPKVRSLILVLLAQILRSTGRTQGMDLSPTTDNPRILAGLAEVLNLPSSPSVGHVVTLDLQQVGVDLGSVPLNEVIAFRAEHGESYRRYARDLRQFVRDMGLMQPEERDTAIRDRREAIEDTAADLRATAWRAWRKPVAFMLMIGGAAWTAVGTQTDPLGALLAAGGALLSAGESPSSNVTEAYSYLFDARRYFGGIA
jgi:hypothetical protein